MTTQVRTELVLDDKASATMDDIRDGFTEVERSSDKAGSSVREFGTMFAATLAAVNIVPMLEKARDLVTSFVDVGSAAYDTEQGIAGMLAGASSNEWGIARAYAEDLNASINDLSFGVGQAKEDIEAGHRIMVTFLGGTSKAFDVAARNMSNLTTVANVQGISMQELGLQFGKTAAGFVSMESPVFNLLKSTGIFSDDITKINQEWQKLTETERIQRLEGAFESIARNLGEAPPTLSDIQSGISAVGDEFLETFGKSAMSGFMGELDGLRGDLGDTRGEMRAMAADFGSEVGSMLSGGVQTLREGLGYVKTHADEIRDAVKEGFQFARDSVAWIIDHSNELAMIGGGLLLSKTGIGGAALGMAGGMLAGGAGRVAGAAASAPVMRGLGGMSGRTLNLTEQALARHVASTGSMSGRFATHMGRFVAAGSPAVQLGSRLAGGITGLAGAIAAGGPPAWAATAAVTALATGAALLAEKAGEAEAERQRVIEDGFKEYQEISQKWGRLTKEQAARMDELRLAAEKAASDKNVPERVGEQFNDIDQMRRDMVKLYINPLEAAQRQMQRFAAFSEAATEEQLMEIAAGEEAVVRGVTQMFGNAWKAHDQGAQEYILSMLKDSDELRRAFLQSADMTAEGFGKMLSVAERMGPDFEALTASLKGLREQELQRLVGETKPVVNFNGGQKFEIKQNFRDQDPDRIAVAFEDRFTRAAISRVQAITTSPFGT